MNKDEHRLWSKVRIGDGCWEWAAHVTPYGYGQVRQNGKPVHAHRAAFTLTHGLPKQNVLHRCNNKLCVRPSHLYDGSHQENSDDFARAGGHPQRKLTFEQAEWVRANASGTTRTQMAEMFGVTRKTIIWILQNKTYKHEPVETEKA